MNSTDTFAQSLSSFKLGYLLRDAMQASDETDEALHNSIINELKKRGNYQSEIQRFSQ